MNMQRAFPLYLFLLFFQGLQAQVLLQGKVVDAAGRPVYNASVYIPELRQGIATDERGLFQVYLQPGNYTVEASALGYERKTLPLRLEGKHPATLRLVLKEKVYQLPEVLVGSKGQDPAYAVMRAAIARAPFYLHQVQSYKAEIYLKGSFKIDKLPRIMQMMSAGGEVKAKEVVGRLFLVEQRTELNFTAPDRYAQKTLAVHSTVPPELLGGHDISHLVITPRFNIYDPRCGGGDEGLVSPLAPDAFSYYKYQLETTARDSDRLVDRIRVIPKKKSPELLSGILYIVEDTWHVQDADLISNASVGKMKMRIHYNEVEKGVPLPVSYYSKVDLSMAGIAAGFQYESSRRYVHLQTKAEVPAAPKQKAKPKHEPFRLHTFYEGFKLTVDSQATRRDSLYWVSARALPLRPEERSGLHLADSLELVLRGDSSRRKLRKKKMNYWYDTRIPVGKAWHVGYGGLSDVLHEYNFVDGFWLGQSFRLEYAPDSGRRQLLVKPAIYYVTARRTLNWKLGATYAYAPLRNGLLSLEGGSTTADFKGEAGGSRLINTLTSLLYAENPLRFYGRRFVEASNHLDLANGLSLDFSLAYESRRPLSNRLSFHFFGGQSPEPNLPFRIGQPMPAHHAATLGLRLSYTPRYYYYIEQGKKVYARSAWPQFTLSYRRGIPVGGGLSAAFDCLEGGLAQHLAVGVFSAFDYSLEGGGFLSKKRLFLPDYKHFRTNAFFLTTNELSNSFNLLGDYTSSTSGSWLEGHFSYNSQYLLLKNLPFLQSYPFDEALHLGVLWTASRRYVEAGYSVGISGLGRLGFFVGDNKWRRPTFGLTVSLPLFGN
ncbi:MAG: DUF5686 and carboxypeptidase regulatory-like domain-containing protein [Tannerella sp.]|nr:DUF5686 and carboxypeptidase regulatory-like domain-containing protein [Tannerella sp.]